MCGVNMNVIEIRDTKHLEEQLDEASEGTTLRLPEGTFSIERPLRIDRSLRIEGAGWARTTIEGYLCPLMILGEQRDMEVEVGNLCLKKGRDERGGGAIQARGAKRLTCRRVRFEDDWVSAPDGAPGGAIFCEDTQLEVSSCIFENNFGARGGAVATLGGTEATIANCHFERNSARRGWALFFKDTTNIKVLHCTFTDNGQDKKGSDVVLIPHLFVRQTVMMVNCLFAGSRKPIEIVRPGAVDLTLKNNLFHPRFQKRCRRWDVDVEGKRAFADDLESSGIYVEGQALDDVVRKSVRLGNVMTGNIFRKVSLEADESLGVRIVAPKEVLKEGCRVDSPHARHDLLGHERSRHPSIGCVE